MMDERLSPSARSVQGQADNPSTIHSIEAILGFKEDAVFHKATFYGSTDKPLQVKDAERNVVVAPAKKSRSTESYDGKLRLEMFIQSFSFKRAVTFNTIKQDNYSNVIFFFKKHYWSISMLKSKESN